MKNVIITILAMLVLGLGGYLVYDKVIDKEEKSPIEEGNKEEITVVDAFSDSVTYPWPTEQLGKEQGEPDTITKKVKLPKIELETGTAKIINDKIYNKYKNEMSWFSDSYVFGSDVNQVNVSYDYRIYKNVLFIFVDELNHNYRGSGWNNHDIYYYDIESDKELTVDEICNRFGITLNTLYDSSAEKIYGVMPTYLEGFDVYYTQDSSCPSYGCKDMYSTLY